MRHLFGYSRQSRQFSIHFSLGRVDTVDRRWLLSSSPLLAEDIFVMIAALHFICTGLVQFPGIFALTSYSLMNVCCQRQMLWRDDGAVPRPSPWDNNNYQQTGSAVGHYFPQHHHNLHHNNLIIIMMTMIISTVLIIAIIIIIVIIPLGLSNIITNLLFSFSFHHPQSSIYLQEA